MIDGHRYTFGYSKNGICKRCGSEDHWTMHCPTTVPSFTPELYCGKCYGTGEVESNNVWTTCSCVKGDNK
jgi:hypothetical protein